MYIGIYPLDLYEKEQEIPPTFYPSLEVMKISGYYKKRNEYVELIKYGDDLTKYSKIYVVKNNINDYFPTNLISNEKCILVGEGFTNGNQLPSDFYSAPTDTLIYQSFIKKIKNNRKIALSEKVVINSLSFYQHEKLFNGEKINCNLPNCKKLVLYDNQAYNSIEALNLINSKNYGIIKIPKGMKVKNIEEAMLWAKQPWNLKSNIYYVEEITDTEFLRFMNTYKDLKGSIGFIIGDYQTGKHSLFYFELWLKRYLYARSKNKRFNLKPKKNQYDYYTDLFKNLADFVNHRFYNKSFEQKYYKWKKGVWSSTYAEMKKRNPKLAQLLQIVPNDLTKGKERYFHYE